MATSIFFSFPESVKIRMPLGYTHAEVRDMYTHRVTNIITRTTLAPEYGGVTPAEGVEELRGELGALRLRGEMDRKHPQWPEEFKRLLEGVLSVDSIKEECFDKSVSLLSIDSMLAATSDLLREGRYSEAERLLRSARERLLEVVDEYEDEEYEYGDED